MMAKKKSQKKTFMVIAVAIALLLYVLSVFIPRSPRSSKQEGLDTPPATSSAVDAELQEALRMVDSEQPMQGILKLREMADRDVHNIDAAWHLGRFSVETGQFENAVKRLDQVVEHDHDGAFPQAYLLLGHAHQQLGNVEKAKKDYTRFLESNTDPQLDQEVRERLKDLN